MNKVKKFKVLTKAQLKKMKGGAAEFSLTNGCRGESCAGNCQSTQGSAMLTPRIDAVTAHRKKYGIKLTGVIADKKTAPAATKAKKGGN